MTTISRVKLVEEVMRGDIGSLYQNLMYKLKTDLEEDLKQEINKNNKTLNLYKFVKSFLKKLDVNQKHKFDGLIKDENKYYLCDGYRLFEFGQCIDGIPLVDNKIRFASMLREVKMDANIEINLKNDELLYMCIQQKNKKDKNGVIFKQGGKNYGFNETYMIDALRVIKDAKVYISENPIKPIYVTGSNNINVMILPIKVPQDCTDEEGVS